MTTRIPTSGSRPSARRGWHVTFVLLLGFTFSFVDRQVLNLLVEPIRADLAVSDTQISFLQGFAFVITYVATSVPIGRMMDTYPRARAHHNRRSAGVEPHYGCMRPVTKLRTTPDGTHGRGCR